MRDERYFSRATSWEPMRWLVHQQNNLEEDSLNHQSSLNQSEQTSNEYKKQFGNLYPIHNSQAWIPFGYGNRSCIGMRTAMLEMKIILCLLFQKFSVRQVPEKAKKELELLSMITLKPKDGVHIEFIPRKKTN
jgi:cytochrome P450